MNKRVISAFMVFAMMSTVFTGVSPKKAYSQENDLVAEYTFDKENENKISDASGNGNDAYLKGGASLITDGGKPAVNLDGADSYIKMPDGILKGIKDMTIATWIYVRQDQNYQRIFDFGNDTSTYMYLTTSGQNDGAKGLAFGITTKGWSEEEKMQSGTDLETGSWKHVAFALSGSTGTLYENGAKVAENKNLTMNPSSIGSTKNNYIGKSQFTDPNLNGMIRDFRIYKRALSADEISAMVNLTDEEIVKSDAGSINLGNLFTVDTDLKLPLKGNLGSDIKWSSNKPDIISSDGKVTRPEAGKGNADVQLTALVTKSSASYTRIFKVTVLEKTKKISIISIPEINIETSIGNAPELPNDVKVNNDDGSTGLANVKWDNIDSSEYANVGNFKVYGKVSGTDIKALANVKVSELKCSTSFNLQKLEPGKDLLSNLNVTNSSSEDINIIENVVLYDTNNRAVKISYVSKQIKAGKTDELSTGFRLPDNVVGFTVKSFIWRGTSLNDTNLEPMSDVNLITDKSETSNELVSSPFKLDEVSLNKSIFSENRDRDVQFLLSVNDDSMLYNFRTAAGLDTKGAPPLTGWDAPDCNLRGHSTGHYLSALAQAYCGSDGNQAKIKQKIDYVVSELGKCQDALSVKYSPGFLSGYSEDQFIKLEKFTTYPTIWAPYYTLHKIMAGLLDCYQLEGNTKALDILKKMGDWVYGRLSKLSKAQLSKMWGMYIAGEFGGMNEVMAKLYTITGDKKYLTTASYFDNPKLFVPMANNIDTLGGMHANQHIPQIIGALQIFDANNDSTYYNIANNFWNMVVNHHTYSIGGTGQGEMFRPADKIAQFISENDCETCATYNMLKLTRNLFFHNPDAKYMDYYERGLYNDILASQDQSSSNGGVTYFMPLNPGGVKGYDTDGWTCCHGTGMENHTKYQDTIYAKSKDMSTLFVNLYIPSTLNWKDKGFKIVQSGDYLKNQSVSFKVNGSGKLDIKLRVPSWSKGGFSVKVNGVNQNITAVSGSYVTLSRVWNEGDTIDVSMPFSFYLDRTPDDPSKASIMYGPLAMVGKNDSTDWITLNLDKDDISKSIAKTDDPLIFVTNGITLVPMYTAYNFAYSAYFKIK